MLDFEIGRRLADHQAQWIQFRVLVTAVAVRRDHLQDLDLLAFMLGADRAGSRPGRRTSWRGDWRTFSAMAGW